MRQACLLILFDLDGTLVKTAHEIADVVNDKLCRFDLPEVTQPQIIERIGHGMRELLNKALAFNGKTDVIVMRVSNILPLIDLN